MSHDDRKFRPWYTPDTARWLRLSLAARGLIAELLRKWDDRGEIRAECEDDIAILLRLSTDEVQPALYECIKAGRLVWDREEGILRDPDFTARQRRSSAERMRDKRRRDAERVTDVTPRDACDVTAVTSDHVTGRDVTSPLLSSDLISSSEADQKNLTGGPRPEPPTKPPEWFADVVEAISMDTGEKFAVPEAWIRYSGHRATKGIAVNPQDARYWLGTVMVPEARKERRAESDRRLNQQRRDGPPERPKQTREEARREAQAFAAELAARNKGAA
jgi:hypothetical protein